MTSSAPNSAGSAPSDNAPLSKSQSVGSDFNGKSFAAGFLPGIAIGAFIATIIFLLWLRKRRCPSSSYVDEKGHIRDTLTDLGPLERRPTMHGRSISEPTVDPSSVHRTDFLRGTPPRAGDSNLPGITTTGYVVNITSPASGSTPSPTASPPKIRALFSRSPFMPQYPNTPPHLHPPVPAHLKRGTLSFKISPVRALKKQKSMHSLRRQMTDASLGLGSNRSNSQRTRISRSGSTETIQVLMPSQEPYTPDRRAEMPEHVQVLSAARYVPPSTSTTTTASSGSGSSDGPPSGEQQSYVTPTRPPVARAATAAAGNGGGMRALGSPYTPTNHGGGKAPAGGSLGVGRREERRDTTFSAMMERAGLRKSDLIVR